MKVIDNPRARRIPCRGLFTDEDFEDVREFFESRPELAPTRLLRLTALASSVGLSEILIKDESTRCGMNAFKVVGVTYAVHKLLSNAPGKPRSAISRLSCATEGNHGRAVARAAASAGLESIVYLRKTADPVRVEAIRREGAAIELVEGSYDDAVRQMASDSRRNGWTIVSDTSWAGYEEIPWTIMLGYTWIMTEAERQWRPGETPAVVVVQAGVGGLAGAVASWLCARYADRRPLLICAEPAGSACVGRAIEAGRPISIVPGDTIMSGLRSGEISPIAFTTLATTADVCIGIDDDLARAAIDRMARPMKGDPVVDAGPSGAAGLAVLLAWLGDEASGAYRRGMPHANRSRAFAINTEGPPAAALK